MRKAVLSACFLAALSAAAAIGAGSPAPSSSEEFFIVSSVDSGKSAMVLKRPTEVTLTMRVAEKNARCRDEQGKPIRFTDLRAGDTVFIASEPDSSGHPVASSVRRGPMTVEELHRRYLRFEPPPPRRAARTRGSQFDIKT